MVGCYGRLDLLLLDEFGYVEIDSRIAELLFLQLIHISLPQFTCFPATGDQGPR